MNLPRPISISITVFAVFFLTSLGMRLPFLESSSKLKPPPNAVFKFFGKKVTTHTIRFDSDHQSHDVITAVHNLTPPTVSMGVLVSPELKTASAAYLLLCPNGRSPPCC